MPKIDERVSLLALCLCAACSYDWTVAEDPEPGVDAGAADADSDPDADPDSEADADPDSDADAAAATCDAVKDQLPAARAAAKACSMLTAACTASVTDECGCTISLWQDSTAAVTRYRDLVAQFGALGCTAIGCSCLTETAGRCLAAGGGAYACSP